MACFLPCFEFGSFSHDKEERYMEQRKAKWLRFGLFIGLGLSIIALIAPLPAHAGGVHLSIGIGIPAPVYVAPPPAVVYPAPVLIQPPPAMVYPPPVVYTAPCDVYGRPLPPGLAKKYYGYHPGHGYKFYKHGW
jgi:hypothetical protein